MANESLNNFTSVEESPDIAVQNPVIEIGYLTSETSVEISPDITIQNPIIEIGYMVSFTSVEGLNDIIYTSNDKRIMTSGNKTILGKIIKRI